MTGVVGGCGGRTWVRQGLPARDAVLGAGRELGEGPVVHRQHAVGVADQLVDRQHAVVRAGDHVVVLPHTAMFSPYSLSGSL